MRTTLDLPENLLHEAMAVTGITTKTEVIKEALQSLIRSEKIKGLKQYAGKVDLDIDMGKMRKR